MVYKMMAIYRLFIKNTIIDQGLDYIINAYSYSILTLLVKRVSDVTPDALCANYYY